MLDTGAEVYVRGEDSYGGELDKLLNWTKSKSVRAALF